MKQHIITALLSLILLAVIALPASCFFGSKLAICTYSDPAGRSGTDFIYPRKP